MNQRDSIAIRSVLAALRQLSNGDFSITLGDNGEGLFFNTAKRLLIELAECLKDWQSERLTSPWGYADKILMVVLNQEGFIVDLNCASSSTWCYRPEKFVDTPFHRFLDNESAIRLSIMLKAKKFSGEVALTVKTADGKYSSDYFSMSRMEASGNIILSAPIPLFKNHITDPIPDVTKFAYDYICKNLYEPLPSSKKLARLLGTNEFTLKQKFKLAYGLSLYHCYTIKRLEKAHDLIASTDMQIKDVGLTCGFRDYATFFKAFRKHYGYTPGQTVRHARKSD